MIAGREVEFLQLAGESGKPTVDVNRRVFHTRYELNFAGVRTWSDIGRTPPRAVIAIPVPTRTPSVIRPHDHNRGGSPDENALSGCGLRDGQKRSYNNSEC